MYHLLDSGNFQKLEQVGPYRLLRPSPQAVWLPRLPDSEWAKADASYIRNSGGDGQWIHRGKNQLTNWTIEIDAQKFHIKMTDFGHLGIFVEQRENWLKIRSILQKSVAIRPLRILNLFAYTGGASLAAAVPGTEIVHVDASKTSNAWARENAELRGLSQHPIRWITEDVKRFVEREERRGSRYHGIILDPPSFGRGNKNEVWKIESDLPILMANIRKLLADDFVFLLLSAHSNGYTPIALRNLAHDLVLNKFTGSFDESEMTVAEADGQRLLPSGASCLFESQS